MRFYYKWSYNDAVFNLWSVLFHALCKILWAAALYNTSEYWSKGLTWSIKQTVNNLSTKYNPLTFSIYHLSDFVLLTSLLDFSPLL